MAIMSEAEVQKNVMRGLIAISSDYWNNFLQYEPVNLVSNQKPFSSLSNICLVEIGNSVTA